MKQKLKLLLPLLLLMYIGIETYLKTVGVEACGTTGCKLAGQLLKFDSTYLNYLGMLGAATLLILGVLRGEFFSKLYTLIASAMVIFESLLIASQININPEPCIFCLGVYTFLLLILFVASPKVFGFSIPSIMAVFISFSFLSIPKNKSLINGDGLYLIASKSCPHCKKTKEFLDKEGIKYKVIKANDPNAWYFAKSLNINKIPIAIEAKKDKYNIIVGDKTIIEKFSKKSEPKPQEQIPAYEEPLKPKINLGGDEGCSYSIIQQSNCESEDGITK